MNAVMLSIRPEWCEKILNGKKTVEIRKTRPNLETPFKCYIYETLGKTYRRKVFTGETLRSSEGRGRVICEFVCNRIENFRAESIVFTSEVRSKSCVPVSDLVNYGNGNHLFAWHISNLVIYDRPKELSQFFVESNATTDYPMLKQMTRPPQSWCYVEELEDVD